MADMFRQLGTWRAAGVQEPAPPLERTTFELTLSAMSLDLLGQRRGQRSTLRYLPLP